MIDTSSLKVSAPAGLGDRERTQSAGGGVIGDGDDGSTARPPLELECGAIFVVAAAAINIELKDGEGEEMRDKGVEEGFVGARKDGGSAKKRCTDCAA
jgi:hypothetical protein